jgi:hypothetical protein
MPRPIPELPPVTTATRPESPNVFSRNPVTAETVSALEVRR